MSAAARDEPDASTFKVGIQLWPQHTTVAALRAAARQADAAGLDSIWTWDHFFPLDGDPQGPHFEAWTLLTAFACDTSQAQLGVLVSGNGYRNPHLVADMARTVDHISGGRVALGIGAGWSRRDYDAYEFPFATAGSRLRDLEANLPRLRSRLARLEPPPLGGLPILIGGGGEKVTLRLVATHADIWNGFGPPQDFARKNAVLDGWCHQVGRDPGAIERSVHLAPDETDDVDAYVDAGARHFIVACAAPFDLGPALRLRQRLLEGR